MQKKFTLGLILFLVSSASLPALEISELDASIIAQKIWMNECNQTIEGLMTWNQGEGFASLGIGHFIWYPMGKTDKFVETFPTLVQFLKDHKVQLPHWLNPKTTCPWHSREEFEKSKRSGKMGELRNLLTKTITLQALFMAERFSSIEPALIKGLPKSDVDHIQAQIERLGKAPGGTYVLLDYLNFKGDGTNPSESYEDKGWGLRQVLLKMPGNTDNPIEEFISGATKVLTDRVELSPPQRNEARWLPGWLNRLKTYRSKD